MDDLKFYLPGTGDNLLFLTLTVLVLLMITGIYGYLNLPTQQKSESTRQRWGWPVLSLFAVSILFYWFGQPLNTEDGSGIRGWVMQFSPFVVGLFVIGFGGAAVFASELKWSLTAATLSFLCGGMLLLQADLLPLIWICWLIAGGMLLLFVFTGISNADSPTDDADPEGSFREPFLACLACSLLLCGFLWVIHREWGPTSRQIPEPAAVEVEGLLLVRQLLTDHWPALIVLILFVLVCFVGITRFISDEQGKQP
ncbi:hypothetical protein [Gimesia sp.]|uniref:hypothetical protein n=1 Tax=Gimesia sp. TaxID=2024833 RepID=UPI003A94000D